MHIAWGVKEAYQRMYILVVEVLAVHFQLLLHFFVSLLATLQVCVQLLVVGPQSANRIVQLSDLRFEPEDHYA